MNPPIDALADAVVALRDAWHAAGADARGMTEADVLALTDRFAQVRRLLDGAFVPLVAEMAVRSRPELGSDGLARRAGHRSPAKLIAAATGGHMGDAARLLQVGEATRERTLLSGQAAPPAHPHVAAAVAGGLVSVPVAAAITSMLDRVAVRVAAPVREIAEKAIVEQVPGLTLDDVQAVLRRAEAHLDPDGLEPRVDELRGESTLTHREDRSGMTVITARLDPATAAPIIAAIEGIVTHQLRVSRGRNTPDGVAVETTDAPDPTGGLSGAAASGGAEQSRGAEASGGAEPSRGAGGSSASRGAAVDRADRTPNAPRRDVGTALRAATREPLAPETRSVGQLRAAALAEICRHILASDADTLPAGVNTTVVVRMNLDDVRAGTGLATIDGCAQPIDVKSARLLAAASEIIPCVLGSDSEILDWGRAKRHFTRAQRRALVERDGGCAFCNLPPAFAEAHHIRWWERDQGLTDLANGILLCTGCHHRVHDEGWEIRIDVADGAPPATGTVWFIPPAHIDPARTPRMGGRRRFDPLLWNLAA